VIGEKGATVPTTRPSQTLFDCEMRHCRYKKNSKQSTLREVSKKQTSDNFHIKKFNTSASIAVCFYFCSREIVCNLQFSVEQRRNTSENSNGTALFFIIFEINPI